MSDQLFQIVVLLLGAGSFITYSVKSIMDARTKRILSGNLINEKRADTLNEIDKGKIFAEIKDDDQFKRLIIDKIIDKYVDQTDRIFQMFEAEFKELVTNIQSVNKTMEKSYAQTEVLRIQSKEFYEQYILKLQRTEGLVIGLLGIFNGLQDQANFIEIANTIEKYHEIKEKLDKMENVEIVENNIKVKNENGK